MADGPDGTKGEEIEEQPEPAEQAADDNTEQKDSAGEETKDE